MMIIRKTHALALAAFSAVLPLLASAALADYTVTTYADNGSNANPTPGSLRAAILEANANLGGTIDIDTDPYVGTITLAGQMPILSQPLTINGNGNTISGNNLYRIFFIDAAAENTPFNINGLTLANGYAHGGNGGSSAGGGLGAGGGIFVSQGNVALSSVSFTGSSAIGGSGGPQGAYLGGGGGLGGNGGSGGPDGGGGGGGLLGNAGSDGGGGGGSFGNGGNGAAGGYSGGGGGGSGNGGNGAAGAGAAGSGGGAPGYSYYQSGQNGTVGTQFNEGGGGGTVAGAATGAYNSAGQSANGGRYGGGGGGGGSVNGGNGGDFGGGGGASSGTAAQGGNGGFGGGGGAGENGTAAGGGDGGFGGGSSSTSSAGAFGGQFDGGGNGAGGAALGAAVFVRAGASLTLTDVGTDVGSLSAGTSNALAAQTAGTAFFLTGSSTISVASGETEAINGSIADISDDPKAATDTASGGTAYGFAPATIIKTGSGALKLGGGYGATNNYGGGTVVQAGVLQTTTAADLGTGGLTLSGGTFQFLSGQPFDLSAQTITIGSGGGTIDTNGNNTTFANPIGNNGSGALTKAGTGTLTLDGSATYTGGTVIAAGTLLPGNQAVTNSLGPITMAGGTLTLGARNLLSAGIPLGVSGLNQDVAVENTASFLYKLYITRSFDTASTSGGYAFFETGYDGASNIGLPNNHTFTSATNPFAQFTLASYSASNVLIVNSGGGTGALTLNQSGIYAGVGILAAGANGNASLSVVLDFSDGSTASATAVTVPDWTSGTAGALTVNSRISTTNGSIQSPTGGLHLYEEDVTVPAADINKRLSGIGFTNNTAAGTETAGIFAVSGFTLAQSYTNNVVVSANSTFNDTGAPIISIGSLTLTSGTLLLTNANAKSLLIASSVTQSGTGALDLGPNDLEVHNGSLSQLTGDIHLGFNHGSWSGTGGITSASAAADSKHLTALGIIQNSIDGTSVGTVLYPIYDGTPSTDTDVLVKYTYYGDANLDGKVDASDYSRIDSGFVSHATGWFNGDFNYDGIINGSDYTLIDNAFNTQGAQLTAEIAIPTAQIADLSTSSVPEPSLFFPVAGATGISTRRRFRKR